MRRESRREREERAVDALLVSILRRVDKDEDITEPDKLPLLTDEEKAAMNALGTDFIDRILAGELPIPPREKPKRTTLARRGDKQLKDAKQSETQTP